MADGVQKRSLKESAGQKRCKEVYYMGDVLRGVARAVADCFKIQRWGVLA